MSPHRTTNDPYLSIACTNQPIHSCNIPTFGPNIYVWVVICLLPRGFFWTVHAEHQILYQTHTIHFILMHTMSSPYHVLPPSQPYLLHSSADVLSYQTYLLQNCICPTKCFTTIYSSTSFSRTKNLINSICTLTNTYFLHHQKTYTQVHIQPHFNILSNSSCNF